MEWARADKATKIKNKGKKRASPLKHKNERIKTLQREGEK